MMEFVLMTVSFTIAILLAMGIALFIVSRPKIMEWLIKLYFKQFEKFGDDFLEGL